MFWFGLRKRIETLERENKSNNKAIAQLFCPHDSFKKNFFEYYDCYAGGTARRWSECSECKRTVGYYKTKEEFLKAKAQELRKQAEAVEKEFCELLDKEKQNEKNY